MKYEETMQGWSSWKELKTAMNSFNFLHHFILNILYIIVIITTVFYFMHIIIPLYPSLVLSDSSTGAISIFIGLLSLIYAIFGINSSTNQLNDAQKRLSNTQERLSDIQIDYWNTRGIDLYKGKKYRDADLSYEKVITLNRHETKAWMNVAVSLYEQSKLDEALNAINTAIEMDQSRADSWNIKGMILRIKAINALENHIELNTDLTEVWVTKHVIPYAKAIVLLENHVPSNDTSGAWNNKGEAILAQALVALEKAIALKTIEMTHRSSKLSGDWLDRSWLAGVRSNMGTILDFQHKYKQAIRAYGEAIGLDPTYTAAWYNKGFGVNPSEWTMS
jgi:tetratricopeptide (TPR) repeat protein